jgi:hypothetical protein
MFSFMLVGTNVSSLARFIIMQWLLEQNILDEIGCDIKNGMQPSAQSLQELQTFRNFNRYMIHDQE